MIEAAAIDGSGPIRRFCTIIFPLISPITFFPLVINTVYAFFDTFGIIHVMTQGGPANATEILMYKVYNDGFVGLDLGGSAAQSVVLMLIVISLTAIQFRYIEKKVEYENYFLSVGRLTKQKNFSFVIKNFKNLKEKFQDIKLVIVGDGELKNKYEKLIRDLKIGQRIFGENKLQEALKRWSSIINIYKDRLSFYKKLNAYHKVLIYSVLKIV